MSSRDAGSDPTPSTRYHLSLSRVVVKILHHAEMNFLELRYGEVRSLHHARTSDNVKLHSWISALGQQGTQAESGRLGVLGLTYPCIHRSTNSFPQHPSHIEIAIRGNEHLQTEHSVDLVALLAR